MKTVLITGANRGIGLEHARCFAARGVHVFATTRSPQESTALAALADEYRGNVTILPYDATDTDSVHLLKDAIGKNRLIYCLPMLAEWEDSGRPSVRSILTTYFSLFASTHLPHLNSQTDCVSI
jgi:NAD(P)-dependent dehydrogenase (short-subunit alcohol dehydrogenase family)